MGYMKLLSLAMVALGAPWAQPGSMAQADLPIDAAARTAVIDGVLKNLDRAYVFPDVAAKMSAAIRERQSKGEYNGITSSKEFAKALTDHLRAISHDKHLQVDYFFEALPDRGPRPPSPEEEARFRAQLAFNNFGFEKVERLAGNIGYLDLRGFMSPSLAGETAAAAMNFLANTDALIVDLRNNGGGDPAMVAFITSYLYGPEVVHLNDLYWRPSDGTHQ